MNLLQRVAAVVDTAVCPFVASGLFARWMTVPTYTGQRSGRTFSIPVGYTRNGDELTIRVGVPGQKNWWRNFLGQDGPQPAQPKARSPSRYSSPDRHKIDPKSRFLLIEVQK